jgi:hypothetical protein
MVRRKKKCCITNECTHTRPHNLLRTVKTLALRPSPSVPAPPPPLPSGMNAGKLDVDSDGQPVFERNAQQNGQLFDVGKAHYTEDLATWKKEKAEDAAQLLRTARAPEMGRS